MTKINPKVIHIAMSGQNGKLCGAEPEDWNDKWLNDKKASKLPKCPDCICARDAILAEEEE